MAQIFIHSGTQGALMNSGDTLSPGDPVELRFASLPMSDNQDAKQGELFFVNTKGERTVTAQMSLAEARRLLNDLEQCVTIKTAIIGARRLPWWRRLLVLR